MNESMTFTDAAREVLRMVGRPLHYKEITDLAIEKNLLSHVGKSPDVTMGARLAATLKKEGDQNPLVRVKPGVFALREWDEETIKQGLEIKRATGRGKGAAQKSKAADGDGDEAKEASEPSDADGQAAAPKPAESGSGATAKPVEPDAGPRSAEEELRAEMAASATGLFAEEEDDDKPIFQESKAADDGEEASAKGNGEGGAEPAEGRRRRRRRRRRGSRTSNSSTSSAETEDTGTAGSLPSYTTSPAFDSSEGAHDGAPRGPQVIELAPGDAPNLDGLAGRDLADAIAAILQSFDRTVGAVSLRQIAETAQRKGKLTGEAQLIQSQIAAAVRADNARRGAAGLRPRFRMAGGRVGLTDWLLDADLARLERDALAAIGRYRDAARRAFVRKLGELPGHAFVELCALLIERVGGTMLRQIKFPGASGSETHLSAVVHVPSGALPGPVGTGEGLRVAIAIRRDGRDVGRERVAELRGTAHHYGSCGMGWLLTAGQVLSGAREEASASNVLPVTLLDGVAIAKLCEEHGVAVLRSDNPIAIPDVDLFEALRAC